jgi:hypothetical protein
LSQSNSLNFQSALLMSETLLLLVASPCIFSAGLAVAGQRVAAVTHCRACLVNSHAVSDMHSKTNTMVYSVASAYCLPAQYPVAYTVLGVLQE